VEKGVQGFQGGWGGFAKGGLNAWDKGTKTRIEKREAGVQGDALDETKGWFFRCALDRLAWGLEKAHAFSERGAEGRRKNGRRCVIPRQRYFGVWGEGVGFGVGFGGLNFLPLYCETERGVDRWFG